jgi:hypothetical protein
MLKHYDVKVRTSFGRGVRTKRKEIKRKKRKEVEIERNYKECDL